MVIDVDDPVVKTYGVPPPHRRGGDPEARLLDADAETAWMMTAFGTGSTSAIDGSSASTMNVAGMIVPPLACAP